MWPSLRTVISDAAWPWTVPELSYVPPACAATAVAAKANPANVTFIFGLSPISLFVIVTQRQESCIGRGRLGLSKIAQEEQNFTYSVLPNT
jgi:hypothetical protein